MSAELKAKVQLNRSKARKWLWRVGTLAVVAGLAFGGWKWREASLKGQVPVYETQAAEVGELKATVTATGTLAGRDSVEVGAEVSGTISKLHVDYNDQIKQGDILLEIDPEQLMATRNQAAARLTAARASYKSARATAKESRTNLNRLRELSKEGLIAASELESAEAAAERSAAQIQSTSADISVAQASLAAAETSLKKATIRSPIDGVVLSRSVEAGQTVAASFQAPVLFLLARDLTKMELSVQIDEADVGRVKEGQPATFTVDAYPKRRFNATLRSLRNVATTTDNVVTYEAVLEVSNDDLSLRPGMTATATITTEHVKDSVLVPNAALRYSPPRESGSAGSSGPSAIGMLRTGGQTRMRGMPGGNRGGGAQRPGGGNRGGQPEVEMETVWVLVDGQPQPKRIQVGVSDGTFTQVISGLDAGAAIIIDQISGQEK